MSHTTKYAGPRAIGWPTGLLFAVLFLICAAVGVAGAYGTYSNAKAVFHDSGRALSLVAGGEGVVLVLGVAMLGLTLIQRPYPAALRLALIAVPAAASVAGVVIAPTMADAAAYAISPMAMTAAAELSGLLARSIVVHRNGVDAEAQRRAADATRRLAYHRARAAGHPDKKTRARSERAAWRLAARVGEGDLVLGADLAEVQRERLTIAADDALSGMFTLVAVAPAVAVEAQVSVPAGAPAVAPAPHPAAPGATATLADVCTVAGIAEPAPGEAITDDQVAAVLRWLKFSTNPPMSGRAAIAAFRSGGYVATEARLWEAWRSISSPTTNP
ncbi:hypothetical protein PUR71_00915 [Streptomyces sp. SP17BM10]|uniref:hypothetical protein n=1 Tax=Streptomyces sp. SP17BM10 TaxID=3002530 RepID=UPI002E79B3F3|nr:hypothetical protein [Streptomyces sp. SP17BM10]MEE1781507.1 hypothetical protein [Streptomyces sp. SP17BM10]